MQRQPSVLDIAFGILSLVRAPRGEVRRERTSGSGRGVGAVRAARAAAPGPFPDVRGRAFGMSVKEEGLGGGEGLGVSVPRCCLSPSLRWRCVGREARGMSQGLPPWVRHRGRHGPGCRCCRSRMRKGTPTSRRRRSTRRGGGRRGAGVSRADVGRCRLGRLEGRDDRRHAHAGRVAPSVLFGPGWYGVHEYVVITLI